MRTLYVGGLAADTDEATLRSMFERFGAVVEARIVKHAETGESRGFGYVTFESEIAAHVARKSLDGRPAGDTVLRVAPAA